MTEEKIAIMQAYLDGKPLEILIQGKWVPVELEPIWDWTRYNYRIAEIDDSIDWSHVAVEYKYLFRVEERAYVLTERPTFEESGYINYHGSKMVPASSFTSYRKGTKDWKNSLVRRPE